jgi:hypothetical protein
MYKNVLLSVVSLLLCLVALEMGVRLYSALAFPKMMVLDSKYGWKHTANVKKIFTAAYREFILPLPFRMTLNRHSYLYYFLNLRYHELFFDKMQRLRLADLSRIGDEK